MSDLIPAFSIEEPALETTLSAAEIAEIDAQIHHLPYRSAAAIEALKIVQAHRGWVSDGSLRALARHLEMSATELDGVATFYNLIFRRPVGEQVILLCNSISCWIKGCEALQRTISDCLGIGPGQTTADNRYTLLPVPCLGACDKAPVMQVGEELHEHITGQSVQALFGRDQRDGK